MTSSQRNAPLLLQGEGFRLRLEPQPGFLRAHVFDGEDSLAVSLAVWRRLGEECRARGVERLLVVEELVGTISFDEVGVLVQTLAAEGFPPVRIAFVELSDNLHAGEHGEILAIEQGFVVQVFSREAEGRHWLLYGE